MLQFPFSPFPVFHTERLVLRALSSDDAAELFQLRTHESVYRYTYGKAYSTLGEIERFIVKIGRLMLENDCIYWAIAYRDNPALIGTICFWNFSTEKGSIEIGYELHPGFHGKGIMQEAFVPVLEFGFSAMHAQKIEGFPHRDNTASVKLLEKFGFHRNTDAETRFTEEERNMTVYERTP